MNNNTRSSGVTVAQQVLVLLDMVRFHAGLPLYEVSMKKNMAISFAIEEIVNKNIIKKPLLDYPIERDFLDHNHPGFEAKDGNVVNLTDILKTTGGNYAR